jgi:hypothetical protein
MAEQERPSRPLPDLRASDAEREHAADVVRRAGGAGRLTVDELDERLGAVYAARTHGELERLLEDIAPAGDRPSPITVRRGDEGTRWIVSIMSGSDRKGRWRVGRQCTVVNVMGGSELDLNDAELADDVVEIRVLAIMGGATIRIPDGLNVEVSEFALLGGNNVEVGETSPDAHGPLVRIRLLSLMGGTDVRRGRKRQKRR